jgi:nucleotide-binding universal stress UspA family protein
MLTPMGRIVVGVDGSEGAAHALRWAEAEAAHRQWTVRAVLAWGYLNQHSVTTQGFDPDYSAEDAEAALASYVRDALDVDGAAAVERHVVADLAARAILEAAADADLLVVGARGLGGFRGLLLGSVSRQCLHEAKIPVAVIRADTLEALAPLVIVGVDGSKASDRALSWAADEARAREATLEVIHAWQPPYLGGYPFVQATIDFGAFEDDARKVMADAIARADLTGLEDRVQQTIVCAGPSSALLEASARSQLVVVGARGIGRVERFLIGSVSDQVAQHATAPVVVVHDPDAA